ncbi:MAG: hypothetical protein F6J95_011170 [Leptolyngbya sp. SIO1E4]|nr:hypothetical protein [Leptolyngbya sp. SIO1E4]
MHQAAINLFQLLVHAGAVPGEDFSCDREQEAYHLSEQCYELLATAYPDVDWQDILGDPYEEAASTIEALHQQLGCPFVDNLVARIVVRLGTLPDSQAAGYVQALLTGVESATGIALYPFLVRGLDMAGQVRLEYLLRQAHVDIPGNECLLDLVLAAGGTAADCEIYPEEVWLTDAGWQRLSQVWDGECTLTPAAPQQRSQ